MASRRKDTAQSDLRISMFSDSVVVSSETDKLFEVIWSCGWISAQLLYAGILTRGGISIGPTVHENNIFYGQGYLNAYDIESKVAFYPRIVLDPKLVKTKALGAKRNFIKADVDGFWYIDPFRFNALPGEAGELAADGHDPRDIYFDMVGKHIEQGIINAKGLDHLAKWTWISAQYQKAREAENRKKIKISDSL